MQPLVESRSVVPRRPFRRRNLTVLAEASERGSAGRLENDMVATVSHELKSPLTSLNMAIQLLLEETDSPLSARQHDLLQMASRDVERLMKTVHGLLDLSRIEEGHWRYDLRPAAPDKLIKETQERFGARARAAGITMTADVAPELPSVLVDRDAIGLVLDNLVENALRYTGPGGHITLSALREGCAVRLAVEDTGVGIASEHLPRIFDRFYQVPGMRRSGAAGLGLAIARQVVVAHGGRMGVESEPGRGSTFFFFLRASSSDDGPTNVFDDGHSLPVSARGYDSRPDTLGTLSP